MCVCVRLFGSGVLLYAFGIRAFAFHLEELSGSSALLLMFFSCVSKGAEEKLSWIIISAAFSLQHTVIATIDRLIHRRALQGYM